MKSPHSCVKDITSNSHIPQILAFPLMKTTAVSNTMLTDSIINCTSCNVFAPIDRQRHNERVIVTYFDTQVVIGLVTYNHSRSYNHSCPLRSKVAVRCK